jgi:hypothetical protein
MSNGFSKIPHGFHTRLRELSGLQLKVWLAHRCMEGQKGVSYPSLAALAQYTGANERRIIPARKWLRDNGWLTTTKQMRTRHGYFSVPTEHTTIPEPPIGQNVPPAPIGQNVPTVSLPLGQNVRSAVGQNARTDARTKCPTEVDPSFEVDPNELHPPNPPTEYGRTAGSQNTLLSESTMLENFQKIHVAERAAHEQRLQGDSGIPMTPNLTGYQALFVELHKRGLDEADQSQLVGTAYRAFFREKYISSFEEKVDAESRAMDAERNEKKYGVIAKTIYIPEAIRCPFALFRKELKTWLDEAQEAIELEEPS